MPTTIYKNDLISKPRSIERLSYRKNEGINFILDYSDDQYRIILEPLLKSYKSEEKASWIKRDIHISVGQNRFVLDRSLINIQEAIFNSKYLLNIEDGWDEEGALSCNKITYNRAIELLIQYSMNVFSTYNIVIDAPEINLTKNGSIDLEWRNENYILLMNVQNSRRIDVHYYGEDYRSKTILKGFINDSHINNDLAFWMRKLV